MSTATTYQIDSFSSDDTSSLGERLGKLCRGGEVLVLTSDLGGGKTTFAKGLARGLGSQEVVTSPTFTVSQTYAARDGLVVHHFDFYRLNHPGVVGLELAEVIDDTGSVTVIEWGDIASEVLPRRSVIISLERTAEGENVRCIRAELTVEAQHLAGAFV